MVDRLTGYRCKYFSYRYNCNLSHKPFLLLSIAPQPPPPPIPLLLVPLALLLNLVPHQSPSRRIPYYCFQYSYSYYNSCTTILPPTTISYYNNYYYCSPVVVVRGIRERKKVREGFGHRQNLFRGQSLHLFSTQDTAAHQQGGGGGRHQPLTATRHIWPHPIYPKRSN